MLIGKPPQPGLCIGAGFATAPTPVARVLAEEEDRPHTEQVGKGDTAKGDTWDNGLTSPMKVKRRYCYPKIGDSDILLPAPVQRGSIVRPGIKGAGDRTHAVQTYDLPVADQVVGRFTDHAVQLLYVTDDSDVHTQCIEVWFDQNYVGHVRMFCHGNWSASLEPARANSCTPWPVRNYKTAGWVRGSPILAELYGITDHTDPLNPGGMVIELINHYLNKTEAHDA